MICNTIHPIPGCGSGTELWQGTTALRRREETAISWRNCDDKRNDTFCFPMDGWMDDCFCSIFEPFAPPSSSSVCQSCGWLRVADYLLPAIQQGIHDLWEIWMGRTKQCWHWLCIAGDFGAAKLDCLPRGSEVNRRAELFWIAIVLEQR